MTPSQSAQKLIGILAVLYLIFVIYGSLVPLHYVPRPFDEALTAFRNIPFLSLGIDSRADWVANLLLFIPLSFFFGHLISYKKNGVTKLLLLVTVFVFSVGLAICIEFIQLYFPSRTVSQNDIMAESLGSCLGLACLYWQGAKIEVWFESIWYHESTSTRIQRALHVYLAVFFSFSILPLDLTISPVEIYHKWNEGRVVLIPFSGLNGNSFEKIYETLTDLLIWLPIGILWSLNKKYPISRIAINGLLAATIIELAQLFVYSRTTDITDIILGGIGTAIGSMLARRGGEQAVRIDQLTPPVWFAFWIVWAIAILAVFWFPYDFDASLVSSGKARAIFFRPILESYYFGSEYHATNEFLRKVGFFLPGGIIWSIAVYRYKNDGKILIRIGILVIFLLALIVESGQLYLPSKYSDFTDVLIQALGGALGIVIAQWILATHSSGLKAAVPADSSKPKKLSSGEWLPRTIFIPPISKPKSQLVTFVGLAIMIGIVTHLPPVPYNIKELIEPGFSGWVSLIGLSLAIQWLINGHFFFLERCKFAHRQMLFLPLWLVAHGLVTWLLLRVSVPMESIHDIVGSPVLGWLWEWELIGRYLALHSVLSLQIIGAIVLIGALYRKYYLDTFFNWCTWSALLAWPLHWCVVNQAATDNLTELMRDGGTIFSSALIAIGFFLFFVSGTSIAACLARKVINIQVVFIAGLTIAFAIPCWWFGSQPVIIKYQKVFSAWQFILSTNREHYVEGFRLYVHFAIACGFLLSIYSLVQIPLWSESPKKFRLIKKR